MKCNIIRISHDRTRFCVVKECATLKDADSWMQDYEDCDDFDNSDPLALSSVYRQGLKLLVHLNDGSYSIYEIQPLDEPLKNCEPATTDELDRLDREYDARMEEENEKRRREDDARAEKQCKDLGSELDGLFASAF